MGVFRSCLSGIENGYPEKSINCSKFIGKTGSHAANQFVNPPIKHAMKYKVHRFDLKMNRDKDKLEQFLNSLKGEVVAITPHVTMKAFWVHVIDYVLVTEKI